jgi:amino acid transporter
MMNTPFASLRKLLLGDPLASSQILHEKISKIKALAVFSSDALSSVAYATEEILIVLASVSIGALGISQPISFAIAALLLIVGFSYYQTIHAYPGGGGAYIVSKDNLGTTYALIAGSALLIDYTLTVAVSISAGVAAITSWIPALIPFRIYLGVAAILLVTWINLRGMQESATIFSIPTYAFILGIGAMIIYGLARTFTQGSLPTITAVDSVTIDATMGGLSAFLILRAFSAGCTALTGIEAISDGVPAFKPPEADNAARTLLVMISLLTFMFMGITFLANQVGAVPGHQETVLSQIGRALFGEGILYIGVQVATALILLLAANTAYSDFPRLSSFLARDGFMPKQMGNLGDRLVFSNGIVLLGLLASALIVLFNGDTHGLLPLYAVGVFISFTLSQFGMVQRWRRLRSPNWQRNAAINLVGGMTTFIVFVIIFTTRFLSGAWIVLLLILAFAALQLRIKNHYVHVARKLSLETPLENLHVRYPKVILPIGGVHQGVLKALSFARSLSPDVTAVYVETSREEGERIRQKWERWGDGVRLVTIASPYRSIVGPLVRYLHRISSEMQEEQLITIVLPQFVPARWWENLLHNQTASVLRLALLIRGGYIVINVPYHLSDTLVGDTRT